MTSLIIGIILVVTVMGSGKPDAQAVLDDVMDESLRSNRVQACDGERMTLQCPKNTHIQIENGFYGRVVPISQLCPHTNGRVLPTLAPFYDATCDVIQAQSRLSELCDKRRKCTILVDASTFGEDPCPVTSKYLQMSYKCRPVSFDGASFCSETQMQLDCNDGKRLAIYSAIYGTTTRGQPSNCHTSTKHLLHTECSRDVLIDVLSRCHAQEGCSLSINDRTLGKVCPKGVIPYLSITFMCVNEEVFSEDAIKGQLNSLILLNEIQIDKNKEWQGSGEWENEEEENHLMDDALTQQTRHTPIYNDASFVPPSPSPSSPSIHPSIISSSSNPIGFAYDIALIWKFMKKNKEKVLLSCVLSLSLALILLVLACILQQFCPSRRRGKDPRVRYSIERSNLINRNTLIGCGHSSFVEMADLTDEPFMRYSYHTPTRSVHYEFT